MSCSSVCLKAFSPSHREFISFSLEGLCSSVYTHSLSFDSFPFCCFFHTIQPTRLPSVRGRPFFTNRFHFICWYLKSYGPTITISQLEQFLTVCVCFNVVHMEGLVLFQRICECMHVFKPNGVYMYNINTIREFHEHILSCI